jgi:uncharacterized membrane protein
MSAASVPEKNVIDRWERRRLRHAHKHAPVRNVNEAVAQSMTFGERASDAFASTMGSWKFIIIQSFLLATWVVLNSLSYYGLFDSGSTAMTLGAPANAGPGASELCRQ